MTELESNNLDAPQEAMVRECLAYKLDSQVGKAEARFRQFLSEPQSVPKRSRLWHMPQGRMRWSFGIVGSALAASLAAVWAEPSVHQMAAPQSPAIVAPAVTSTATGNPVLVEQDMQSQTFDDGTVMLDDTAVRVLRRRDTERTRWFDQNRKLQGEQVVPRDHVVYVQVKTY